MSGVESGDEQDIALIYHVNCLIRGLWTRFKGVSLPCRVLLGLAALCTLFIATSVLVQLVILLINPMCTILGIIASAIAIYEFFVKKQA